MLTVNYRPLTIACLESFQLAAQRLCLGFNINIYTVRIWALREYFWRQWNIRIIKSLKRPSISTGCWVRDSTDNAHPLDDGQMSCSHRSQVNDEPNTAINLWLPTGAYMRTGCWCVSWHGDKENRPSHANAEIRSFMLCHHSDRSNRWALWLANCGKIFPRTLSDNKKRAQANRRHLWLLSCIDRIVLVTRLLRPFYLTIPIRTLTRRNGIRSPCSS